MSKYRNRNRANSNRQNINAIRENIDNSLVYMDKLTELAISMFEWENVPETINIRYLEEVLFSDGQAVFFRDDALGFLALRVGGTNEKNLYGEPVNRCGVGSQGYHSENLTESNSVMIYNNYLKRPSYLDMLVFAKRLANVDTTIDINIYGQRTPILLTCDENTRLSIKNLYMNYDGGSPVIFGTKGLDKNIGVLSTGVPYLADKLTEYKTQVWNEALTYLGISNISLQKKERMITDEVNRSLGGTLACRFSRLGMRQEACDKINKLFGLNMSVKFREGIEGINVGVENTGGNQDESESLENSEGDENE